MDVVTHFESARSMFKNSTDKPVKSKVKKKYLVAKVFPNPASLLALDREAGRFRARFINPSMANFRSDAAKVV